MTLKTVAGLTVDSHWVENLNQDDVVDLRRLSRALQSPTAPDLRLNERVAKAFPDYADKPKSDSRKHSGEVATKPVLLALRMLGRTDLAGEVEKPQDLPGWPAAWRRYKTNNVIVSYTLDGDHALQHSRRRIGSTEEHPAHVILVAYYAEEALRTFTALELPAPACRDEQGYVHIRLVNLEGRLGETNPGWNHIAIDRDLEGRATQGVIAHELFHQCQYAANSTVDVDSELYSMMREGGARLAEILVVHSAVRYITDGYLNMPARPLAMPKKSYLAPHSYSAALFWKYVCEQHGTLPGAAFGFDAYKHALETMRGAGADGSKPYLIADLRRAREKMAGPGQFDKFIRIDNDVICTETTWGNFVVANWINGTPTNTDRRFFYKERDDLSFGLHSASVEAIVDLSRLKGKKRTTLRRGGERPVPPFSASYYQIELDDDGPKQLRFTFDAQGGMTDPLVQLLRLGPGNTLEDLIRVDRVTWTKVIPTAGLERVMVIVAAREGEGQFELCFEATSGHPLVSTTRCNCGLGKSYETAWLFERPSTWNWSSPDLEVQRLTGTNNEFEVGLRLRNNGDTDAQDLGVNFGWKAARRPGSDRNGIDGTGLETGKWSPIGETRLSGPLKEGGSAWVKARWILPEEAKNGFAVRAEIELPDALKADDQFNDDKVAIGIFL
jgi:hypothetical protein